MLYVYLPQRLYRMNIEQRAKLTNDRVNFILKHSFLFNKSLTEVSIIIPILQILI